VERAQLAEEKRKQDQDVMAKLEELAAQALKEEEEVLAAAKAAAAASVASAQASAAAVAGVAASAEAKQAVAKAEELRRHRSATHIQGGHRIVKARRVVQDKLRTRSRWRKVQNRTKLVGRFVRYADVNVSQSGSSYHYRLSRCRCSLPCTATRAQWQKQGWRWQ
jgi:hypothetical protein